MAAKPGKRKRNSTPRPVPAAAPPRAWYRGVRNQALFFFALAVVLYANTLGHDFAVDDAIVIYENTFVQQGLSGIGDLFSHDTFYGFFNDEGKANLVAGGRYRPLTLAMFAIEQQLSPGPMIGHLFNVLWYGGLAALLICFLNDLFRTRQLVWWLAPLTVLLFVTHPIHTEVVANIKGRDEIVALFFAVLATWLTWRAAQRGSWLGAVAGAVCLGVACLAKETAFTFLAVIPLTLVIFPKQTGGHVGTRQANPWKNLRFALPTLAIALAYLALRSAILPDSPGTPNLELMNNPFLVWTGTAWQSTPDATRLATGFAILLDFLRLSFLPHPLIHDYYPTALPLRTWSDPLPWLGLLSHLALAALALFSWTRARPLALGIVIYLASLSVASNIFFPIGTLLSERFLFFPSLGWAMALAYGMYSLRGKIGTAAPWAGVFIAALFAVLTLIRNPDWKDNLTLFTTDVDKQPDSAKLLNAAAGARLDAFQALSDAERARNQHLIHQSITDLERAIRIHPTYANAYLLYGNAHLLAEDYDEAIRIYNQALALHPDFADAEENLFVALRSAGRSAGEEHQDLQGAFRYLAQAERLRPNDYETLRLLGVASGMSGQNARALTYFERARAARPNDADAVWNYGTALYNAGQHAAAQQQFARAQEIRPEIARERGAQ